MRKTIKIVALITGIISAVAVTVLGCIYLNDISAYFKKRIAGKQNYKNYLGS